MTTAEAKQLRQSILDRAFGFREPCFEDFRDVDFQILQFTLDVAFCGVAKVSDIVAKAAEAGIRKKTVSAALFKMDSHEMIYPCTDPHTGIECVHIHNFDGTEEYKDIDEMQSLE